MLDFKLDLVSPLFLNLRAYKESLTQSARMHLPFLESLKACRAIFPDLNEMQFLELRYEFQEWRSVHMNKPRHKAWDIGTATNVSDMLYARNDPDFEKTNFFFQTMGRGMRINKPHDLIGKEVYIRIKRPKDE